MRVLVADDDPVLQAIAKAVLEPEGYELLQATDGLQALEMYRQLAPDVVLTDYDMPGLDGLELCRRIQAIHSDHFVPIVIFTGAAQPGLLRDSLEAGAIEFLTKPFQPDELRCRVKAIAELAQLHNAVVIQKAQDDEELLVVKHVLDRLIEPGLRELPPSFHMETLPTQRINGDACTYSQGLPGVHFGLLCDATGHGLMAGISTIPVVQAFLSMTRRDIPLEHVFAEINSKLMRMLPTGRFACVMIFRMDLHQHVLSVLNAGFPEALLRRNDGSLRRFGSRNIPAGVQALAPSDLVLEFSDIQEGERFFAYSDGLQELCAEEEIHDRLLGQSDQLNHEAHRVFLRALLRSRVQDLEQHDDISWALWEVPKRPEFTSALSPDVQKPAEELRVAFRTDFTLSPPFLGLKDLVPNLLLMMGQQGVDQSTSQLLGLLVTEALANAVDHGILGLASDLKLEQGFEAYEAERSLRIAEATSGQVRIALSFLEATNPSRLRAIQVDVEDSGPGFDWRSWTADEDPEHPRPFGRGLTLIRALAVTVAFNETGNQLSFRVPMPEQ